MNSFTFFSLLIISIVCNSCRCDGNPKRVSCFENERLALFQFKHDLIDDANQLFSWSSENNDCCGWAGVVCDNFTGHVLELHLRGPDPDLEKASAQMLRGNINPSLLLLKQLKYLDLSCNNFSHIQIPSFIGSLGNLRYLNLSMSQFQGGVPYELGNLSMLAVLDINNGRWATDYPVKSLHWLPGLPLLQHLDMSGHDLGSASDWLQMINTLPSLIELHLISCNLNSIPGQLTKVSFTSLTILDLSYNLFNSSMPRWIFSLSKLVSLDLTRCLFHGPVPDTFSGFQNMTDLKVLRVSENDFMNSLSVLRGLLSLTSLEVLDINTCNISTPILSDLQTMPSLVSIDLSQNKIKEILPNSFVNLCNLIFIDLRDNFFTGNVSDLLNKFCECKSPKLESIACSSNRLYGCIPDRIGQLQNLVIFDLAFNYISGIIPHSLGRLSSLENLILNVNSLSGQLPDSVGNLTSLKWLEISFNNISGTLPRSLGKLKNLNFMSVHHNSLTGVVTEDHFANLEALDTLRAEGNMLTLKLSVDNWIPPFKVGILRIGSWNLGPHFPSWLQTQTKLWDLDIANTKISDTMPSWFPSTFFKITFLNISHNRIQGPMFRDLSFVGAEAVVDLSNNYFKGPLPQKFNEADGLVFLDVSNNRLSGPLKPFLCPSLEKARSLMVFDVSNNNLSGVIPDCWRHWQNLAVLSFQNNNFSGEIPQSVSELPSLQSLNIRNNKLSGKIHASLLNLKSLQILELAENAFNGRIPLLIEREETNLKLLSLRSNKLEGEIPVELCRLTSIQILDLAHNNFSGALPTCFYNFSSMFEKRDLSPFVLYDVPFQVQVIGSASLVAKGRELNFSSILYLVTTLDLSGNKFSGPIPKVLMGLVGLRWLNLSGNHLTGRIPEEIGKMTLLESLDLSVNHIDGRIPWSISRLTFLSSLNLSFNNLIGQIPTSTQLQNLNETSFMGNLLCGPPLVVLCNKKPETNTRGEQDQNDDESDVLMWGFVISIVLGFTIGFWIVVAPLIFSKTWRSVYFNFFFRN